MTRLPRISGGEAVKAFELLGWLQVRQSGSPIILVREGLSVTLSIPDHKELAKGTLRSLIRSAGITVQEFVAACPAGQLKRRETGRSQLRLYVAKNRTIHRASLWDSNPMRLQKKPPQTTANNRLLSIHRI